MDEEWLALQPEGAPEASGHGACLDGPHQPLHLGQGTQGSWGDGLTSEIEPASPRVGGGAAAATPGSFRAAAGSSRSTSAPGGPGGGGSGASRAAGEGAGGEGEEALVMQKHLAFSSPLVRLTRESEDAWRCFSEVAP